MPFFADTGPGGFQPKRKFRFLVTFSQLGNLTFMVKSINKPSYTMAESKHNVLNHVFKFPGVVTWSDVKCTFVDALEPNVGSKFYRALINSGYVAPTSEGALVTGITKVGSTSALGEVRIKQLDGGGIILPPGSDPGEVLGAVDVTNVIEEWTLKNAFIKGVTFGEAMSYDSEDLVDVGIDLVYDYATYSSLVIPLAT
tara:strand:+ start:125 stop:718 length:594 start_codon:yes stop_codon:yes gene_type:complete